MVIDADLLARAREAGAKLVTAERESQLARAEYHTVVRRLHLSGASFREIAEALQMSHQRVQQIVDSAGGSWWQRTWGSRNATRDAVCTFCERPASEVAKLLAGPNVFVCDDCLACAEAALSGRGHKGGLRREVARARCSFCGKRAAPERAIARCDAAAMCSECVSVSRQILRDRAG